MSTERLVFAPRAWWFWYALACFVAGIAIGQAWPARSEPEPLEVPPDSCLIAWPCWAGRGVRA